MTIVGIAGEIIAMRTRRTNIALRMLEIPLHRAATADDTVQMLQRILEQSFQADPLKNGSNTREFDRLLAKKLVFSLVLLLVVIRPNGIFPDKDGEDPIAYGLA